MYCVVSLPRADVWEMTRMKLRNTDNLNYFAAVVLHTIVGIVLASANRRRMCWSMTSNRVRRRVHCIANPS
jgi:hypothetical protein